MHKTILKSDSSVMPNESTFPYFFQKFKQLYSAPTKQIAVYEEYLKQWCTINNKDSIKCLQIAGETYERIAHKECALICYQDALALDKNGTHPMARKVAERIKTLTKPLKSIGTNDDERRVSAAKAHEELAAMYEADEEQWSIYWSSKAILKDSSSRKSRMVTRLHDLAEYLRSREKWYDTSDSNIVLHRPSGNAQEQLSIDEYRSHFLPAVHKLVSLTMMGANTTNHPCLAVWRYKK